MKISHGFRAYGLYDKKPKPGKAGNQQKLSNLENTYCYQWHYYETTDKLPIWYLSTILVLITRKATFTQ